MLYGVERWISYRENLPAFREKTQQLRQEIQSLQREKPEGWQDLSRRYRDAIDGLNELIERTESTKN
jgi:hypothetical protein